MVTQETIKVAVCVPSGDEVKTDFALSLARMCLYNSITFEDGRAVLVQWKITNIRSSNLAESRHLLAKASIESGADYVLFIDSDMKFPPETMVRLLSHQLPIVACTCATRVAGAVVRGSACTVDDDNRLRPVGPNSNELVEADRVGTGVLLVATEVLKKIPLPWFLFPWDDKTQSFNGEDYYFCEKVRAAGFKIYVDLPLSRKVGHVGQFVFTLDEARDMDMLRTRTNNERIYPADTPTPCPIPTEKS